MQHLLDNHIEALRAYWMCAQRHRDTVEWIDAQRAAANEGAR